MKFQNKFKEHDLSQEENARLDNLRRRMLSIIITIIEHEDLFFGSGISTEEPDLAMFRYKKEDEELLMKMQAPESVYSTFDRNNIFYYFYYFLCRFSKGMLSSSCTESTSKYTSIIITDPSTTKKAALSNVWASQTQKTGVWNKDRTDHQSANWTVVIIDSRPTGEHDIS